MSNDQENGYVVLDVSLLAPQSHDLVKGLLDEGNVTLVVTRGMLKMLRDAKVFNGLLRLWNIRPGYAKTIESFVRKVRLYERIKHIHLEDLPERIREHSDFLQRLIHNRGVTTDVLADYVTQEMSLALAGYPILCTATSRRMIVEFFRKIGAKIKKPIHVDARRKARMLKTKKFRLLVLAKGLSVALVYVLTGPLDALAVMGAEAIVLIIVNG